MTGVLRRAFWAIGRFLDRPVTAWIVGVAMPVAMLLLDPIVFRGGSLGLGWPVLAQYRTASYVGIGAAIVALVMVLTTGRGKALFSGVMAAAAGFGLLLGLVILPLSLFGMLLLGVGVLGFSPFLAAALFARWSYRSFRGADAPRRRSRALLGAAAFCALWAGTQVTVSHVLRTSLDAIVLGHPRGSQVATERLKRWRPVVDLGPFITAWLEQDDPDTRRRLVDAYRAITGEDLEAVVSRAMD